MTDEYERTHLWKLTLAKQKNDDDEVARDLLRNAYLKFRDRVSHLVATLRSELPGLTVHAITHLDALWRVADQIAGPKYALTRAEAFVLGGAILLHDSAHAIAAFPGGKAEIKQTQHWRDLIAHRYKRQEPANGSDDERAALFQVLRHLHATQAAQLPFIRWQAPGDSAPLFLLEDTELRQTYGELIGRIAESHHWPAHRVATDFGTVMYTPPSYLPGAWTVDAMKVAFLLRTADAAHVDDKRAPWFLFALQKPEGISAQHWRFQSKLGQPLCNKHGELQISSASSFNADERHAWWLAYDTVQMIDRELRDAHGLMQDCGRPLFQARSVLGAGSPESFARYVKPIGWEPVDVAPKISSINKIIEMLGGQKLYGQRPEFALRELLQNALDAVRAKRALGGLNASEGEIVVSLEKVDDDYCRLTVSDDGLGMSRYVMTNVLLDFGNSLWKSDSMRSQWPSLSESTFKPAGQFGVGFYSIFMLGERISVTSQRWPLSASQDALAYILEFDGGLESRPSLRKAGGFTNRSSGTDVVVNVVAPTLMNMLRTPGERQQMAAQELQGPDDVRHQWPMHWMRDALSRWIAFLVPMTDVKISVGIGKFRRVVVEPDDWLTVTDEELAERIQCEKISRSMSATQQLRQSDGEVVGRVGLGSSYAGGLLHTHGGITCDHTGVLYGVIRSGNPENAARTNATTEYPISVWKEWAERTCKQSFDNLSRQQMLRLHQLVPREDFPIFEVDGQNFTAAEVAQHMKKLERVAIHAGDIEYDDGDEVTGRKFEREFCISQDVICIPKTLPSSPNAWLRLPLEKIDYLERLRIAFRGVWTAFREEDLMYTVGEADGIEIIRSVTLFERST